MRFRNCDLAELENRYTKASLPGGLSFAKLAENSTEIGSARQSAKISQSDPGHFSNANNLFLTKLLNADSALGARGRQCPTCRCHAGAPKTP